VFQSTVQHAGHELFLILLLIHFVQCYTTQGLELTRVTVVDFYLAQIIDLFVKPDNPIVDYNTKYGFPDFICLVLLHWFPVSKENVLLSS